MRNLDLLNISGEQSFVFVMTLIVLVALTLPALTTDVAAQERTRYDLSNIESQIHAEVNKTLTLYMEQGTGAFDVITSVGSEAPNTIVPFVVESATLKIVAHGAGMPYVDQTALTLTEADMTIDHIRAELERIDRVWIKHIDINPANGQPQTKRTLLHLHDGYIFGAGYYLPDSEVQQFIEDTVQLYETHGVGVFDIITPEEPVITDELYPFIINATSWTRLADGVVPARVGQPETILDTSSRSVTDVLDELEARGSVWVTYTFHNPATDVSQLKRTWLYLYDGLVFGSGYYPHDFRAQSLADSAKILYMARGIAAFDIITPDVPDPLSTQSTFVLNAATLEVVAHGRAPGLVGTISPYLNMADKSLQDIKEELQYHEDGIWVWHMSRNPATQTDQLTHSYIILYDGYIFGASISLPDIRVQSVVDDTIYTYRNNPETGFDVISSGMLNHIDMYPVATNSTHILAHGGVPSLAGSVRPLSTTGNDVMLDQLEEGDSWWTQVAFYDVFTGITQIKRAWYIFHDDYIFLSPYTVADADTQSVTDYARFIYESNRENNAWVDIITPKQPVITDALYPFVINSTSWTRLADGVVPARVGQPETILDTSGRSVDDVLAELRENGRIWLTYTFHNPATGVEQLKRTYLQLHDGLVFGSGYYILDSQVQAVTFSSVLQYEDKGKDAAIAAFDAAPDEPLATYLFVVDPQTGTTLAQNVNPNLIGHVADWGAITEVLATQDIIDAISRGTGTWVAYNHINPVTSNEETKRTWLVMHDGLIFGSGYYSSNIPESDVIFAVSNTIRTYESNRADDTWIDVITPDEPITTDALYPFVINATSWTRLADGVVPARVGQPETILDTSSRSVTDVLDELEARGSVWVTYTFHNPATGVEQIKRSYLQLHDGLVFGSGYYTLDYQVQSALQGHILEYERDGRTSALASVDIIPDEPFTTYLFVVDPQTGTTLAQNVNPNLIGHVADWGAITEVLATQDIIDAISRGTGTWVAYNHINPVTSNEETKRTWLVMHDGLIFGSGYYSSNIPESDVIFAVSNTIRTYESNRADDTWIDVITPDEPITTDALYPFVINATSWTRLADGVVPARVGQPETILDTSSRSVTDVLDELEARGSVWVTYTFHNPATGVEQIKRSYLQLHDGLVFGSGYYTLDYQVQSALQGHILEYERDGRTSALASVDIIPDEPFTTYLFVVDPQTGTTLAQNVNPNLIGHVADWGAITEVLATQDIIDAISRGTGTWVAYNHINPVTSNEETKRTWLVMHDGLIFGSGYYVSDILAPADLPP